MLPLMLSRLRVSISKVSRTPFSTMATRLSSAWVTLISIALDMKLLGAGGSTLAGAPRAEPSPSFRCVRKPRAPDHRAEAETCLVDGPASDHGRPVAVISSRTPLRVPYGNGWTSGAQYSPSPSLPLSLGAGRPVTGSRWE